jgi:phosphinothricin acetyltransferase
MSLLRLARTADAPALAAIYGHYVAATPISFETAPPPPEEMARRLTALEPHAPWLVCERAGKLLGYAYLSQHHERAAYAWSVDCAVYVASDRRGEGVGRSLYTALFALAALQGFYAVHAGISLPNAASVGLHEAFGFRQVALYPKVGFKFGAWHDVGWWQLELRERVGEPAAPRTPGEARAASAAEWAAALAAGSRLLGD